MKHLFPLPTLIFFVACTSGVKETPGMQGAYFMISQTLHYDTADRKYTDLKQLKIYTDSLMMYTQVNPGDSSSGFGVGSYIASPGHVTEYDVFRTHDTIVDPPDSFSLGITKTVDGYSQVIPHLVIDGRKAKLTEEYHSTGKAQKTPLDGVWKQTLAYTVNGKDTITNNQIVAQYKTFYAGYFMWGQATKDSLGTHHTGIGFGTFDWVNDKQIKETDLNSTFAIIAGQSFNVDIDMSDPNHFSQTISYPDGTKSVEVYARIGK
ncbi:MAG TPA: hypothetical protein VG847_09450 [Chitinophagaceae bacterium]|nr:hypothetical protein [Chitinophagaceae bacterium]